MDEQMDHGPIIAQKAVPVDPFPDHYRVVEEKLAKAGGKLLTQALPVYLDGELKLREQEDDKATFVKMVKKEDGLLDLNDDTEKNYRKVLAYSTWPGAYLFFSAKGGSANPEGGKRREVRIVVKDAKIEPSSAQGFGGARDGKFVPVKIIPEGKREMDWQDFLRGNA